MSKLYSAYVVKNTLSLLTAYTKSISSKTELQKAKNRYITDLNLIIIMLKELVDTTRANRTLPISHRDMLQMINNIEDMIRQIEILEEGQQTQIREITSLLEEYKSLEYDELDTYNAERWVDYAADDIYNDEIEEMKSSDLDKITNKININRAYNIFSPRCGRGMTLAKFKKYGENTTYGLESRDSCHFRAKEALDRVIKGEMHGSKISNDCFDIMCITPPISWKAELGATGNLLEKKEKAWLRNTIKYLRSDGILIYTIPVTRLTNDIAFICSKLLKDVQVIKATVNTTLPFIHIIGKKDISKESRKDVYKYLCSINKLRQLPDELDMSYNLASGGIILPDLFRGSVLDESELEQIVSTSGLMESFWKQHEIEEKDSNVRPLLPFNMGQIGLVLTSGCLDGVVEEYEGQYHAIKGMVTKIRDFSNNVEDNDETSIETISNKVQINLLTPDGQFIELA